MRLPDVTPLNDEAVQDAMDQLPDRFPGCLVTLIVGTLDEDGTVTNLSCMANGDEDDVHLLLKDVVETRERDQQRIPPVH